jgi:DNA invertase Pin-like site-specific DNA recombinase
MTMKKMIAYLRVSTKMQGDSGLGLEAQRAQVVAFAQREGAEIIQEYVEVESGKLADRPQLSKALAHAKRSKALVCCAKLDRLARNVAFLSALMEAGVDFVACDNPHANRLTIHILAAVAEDEARRISDRTKAALQALKARGVKLGSARDGHWQGREDARLRGAREGAKVAGRVNRQAADDAYADLYPMMAEMRSRGTSLREIASALNSQQHTTRYGREWSATQVLRVLRRAVTV